MPHEAWREAMTLTLDCVYQVMTARFVYPLRLPFTATVLALVRSGRLSKHRWARRRCRLDRRRWPASSTATRITGTIWSVTVCRRGSATVPSKCPCRGSCLHLQAGS